MVSNKSQIIVSFVLIILLLGITLFSSLSTPLWVYTGQWLLLFLLPIRIFCLWRKRKKTEILLFILFLVAIIGTMFLIPALGWND